MTVSRQILPGGIYEIAFRTRDRRLRLVPDAAVRQMEGYLLAEGARRYGVRLIGAMYMSNHVHLIVWDPRGQVSAMLQFMNGQMSTWLNRRHGLTGRVWEDRRPYIVQVLDGPALIRRLVYILTNPVKDGLVKLLVDWPGFWMAPGEAGGFGRVIKRPRGFRKDGTMPAVVRLQMVVPPTHQATGAEAYRKLLRAAVDEELERLRALRKARGLGYLGKLAVLRQDPTSVPVTLAKDPGGPAQPAASTPKRKRQGIEQERRFRAAYAMALAAFKRCMQLGKRQVVLFPYGTDRMRRIHGVRCHLPPPGLLTAMTP